MLKIVTAAVLVWAACQPVTATAQQLAPEQAAPAIKLVHPGAKYFYVDLDYVLGLTTSQEQKQLPLLKKFGFDPFLEGVDGSRILRIDVLTGEDKLRYLTFVPLSNLDKFRRENLQPAGIESRKLAATLYKLQDDFGVLGFMQIQNDYAAISGKRADVPNVIADPQPGAKELAAKYDLGLDILNTKIEPAAIDVRKKQFETHVRKELFEMVQKTEIETDDAFEFRQLFTDIQLDELGRVYSSARHARLGLIIDEKRKDVSSLDIFIDPLPETELAGSFDLLAKKPSDFANIARGENNILSARINHPLDEMRQKNFVRLSQFLRKQTKKEYDTETTGTAAEKANRQKAVDLFFDMVDAGLKSGVLDAFAEAHPAEGGKNTIVGGILVVDGNAIIEPLKLFAKESVGQKSELNVDEAGDVKIHRFTAAKKDDPVLNDFFGSDVIYIGSSEKAVWYAAGANALDELKAAIARTAEPNTGKAEDPVTDIEIKLGPWAKLRQAMQADETEDKELIEWRQLAVEAFAVGDDSLKLNLNRVENRVEGLMTGQPGLMRLIGKLMADFSKENFDD